MPIYEYSCTKCGVFDHMQKITEKPLKKCPECGGKVTKLMSNTAFQLKGSGWYITDYARKGSSGSEGKSSSPVPSPASASEGASGAGSSDSGSTGEKKKPGGKKGGESKAGSSAAA